MTCEHIEKAKKKINELVGKYNDSSSSYFYETCGPYVEENDIKSCVNCLTAGLSDYLSNDVAVLNRLAEFMDKYGKISTWTLKRIRGDVLYQHLSNVFDELKGCDCYNEAVRKTADKLEDVYEKQYSDLRDKYNKLVNDYNNLSKDSVRDYNVLKDKYNKLVDEYNDKNTDYQDMKEKYEDTREELHDEKLGNANKMGDEKLKHLGEKSQLQIQNTKLQEKLEAANSEKINLRKQLKDKEDENSRLLIKLDDKSNQLVALRIESSDKDSRLREKDSELQRKKEEIEELKSKLGTTQKTAFDEKIQFKEEKLEFLAEQLGIELRRIQTLRRRFKELIVAQENKNSANVNTAQDNITAIKEDLQENGISISNVQRICKKCKKIAQLELQLEKPQSTSSKSNNDNKKDWKNINSSFTPELVKEWQNHGFTYEQCQEWINTSPVLQRERAIEEPDYYAWLRDVKKVDAEWLINYGNERALSLEFIRWQQNQYQTQQEQPNK